MGKKLMLSVGLVFLVLSGLGFTHVLNLSMVHSGVYGITGALLLYPGVRGGGTVQLLGKVIGLLYLVLGIIGWVSANELLFGHMTMTTAYNRFHIIIGIIVLYLGLSRDRPRLSTK